MKKVFFLLIFVASLSIVFSLPGAYAVTVTPGVLIFNPQENLTANVIPNFNVTSITANTTDIFFNDRFFDFQSTHGTVPANITAFSENNYIRLHITKLNLQDVTLFVKGKVNSIQLDFLTRPYGDSWLYDPITNTTTINVNSRIDVYVDISNSPTSATLTTAGTYVGTTVNIQPIAVLSSPGWTTIYNQTLFVNGSLFNTINYPPSVISLGSNTLGLQTVTGVLHSTTFQSKMLVGSNTGNVTITGNIIGFGSGPRVPGPPTLTAVTEGPTEVRFISVANSDPGTGIVYRYDLQCKVNDGIPINTVIDQSLPPGRFYSYTGLNPGDTVACKWRDGNTWGFSAFSNEAKAQAGILSVVHPVRSPLGDPIGKAIAWIDSMGGMYFGLSVIPLLVMLIGMLATPKTTGIFAIITLICMGIIQATGYHVYPQWYWLLAFLLGLVVVLSRANEKER